MVNKYFGYLFCITMHKKYRYSLFILFFILFTLNFYYFNFTFELKPLFVIDFFKLMASIVGIFLSVIIGLYFFIHQDIDNKRHIYFFNMREKIDLLKEHLIQIPPAFDCLKDSIAFSIDKLDEFKISDGVPFREEERDKIFQIVEDLEEYNFKYTGFMEKENHYIDKMVSLYIKIEEFLDLLLLMAIKIFSLRLMFGTILRIVFNLSYYLILIVIINLLHDNGINIDENILGYLLFFGLCSSFFYILQIVTHFIDYYRNTLDAYFEKL